VRRETSLSSPSTRRELKPLKPCHVASSPAALGPSSPYVAQMSDKPVSAKICLLGTTFLITGYQERSEAVNVNKWRTVIENHGGCVVDSLTDQVTHVLAPSQNSPVVKSALSSQRRLVTAHWLNDIITAKKLRPPWRGVHFPLPAVQRTDCSDMSFTVTGFKDQQRDYVKDMIEQAGATYTSSFSRDNSVIICKAFSGEKHKTSLVWKVPAVSISWLNDVLFGSEDVTEKVHSSVYRKLTELEEDLGIRPELVSDLLEAWKKPVFVTNETFYSYKERQRKMGAGKRSLDYDQAILTPDRKKVKIDPRALFEKKSKSNETKSDQSLAEINNLCEDDEINFDFYKQREKVFADRMFYLTPDVQPSVEVLRNMIENAGGRVENRDIKTISKIKKYNQHSAHSYIIIAGARDLVEDLLQENIKIFTSDFVFNSILHCYMDFEKDTL